MKILRIALFLAAAGMVGAGSTQDIAMAAGSVQAGAGAASAPTTAPNGAAGSAAAAPTTAPPPGPAGAPGASAPGPGQRPAGGPPGGPGAPPPPPTASQKTEEYYKNIQALKGYPADSLMPAMQFISASLGVDCEYCHVERQMDKDDKKEKVTARKMIAMNLAINRESFDGRKEVTCYSCHRGAARPLSIPAVAKDGGEPEAAAPRAAELPPAGPILDRYLQASGGAEALGRITSRVQKGTLTGFGGQPMPVEVYAKAPDMRVSIVRTPRGDSITAFDGHGGWTAGGGRPPRDKSAAESEAARLDAELRFPARVGQLFKEFRTAPGETLNGRDTLHIVAKNEGQPPVELWFDAQSGLLVRLVRYAETPLGRNPTQIDYADYRDADGVKVPFRWTVARPTGAFTIQVDELKQNVPVEDGKFSKPAP